MRAGGALMNDNMVLCIAVLLNASHAVLVGDCIVLGGGVSMWPDAFGR